jgi:hypothetical protein
LDLRTTFIPLDNDGAATELTVDADLLRQAAERTVQVDVRSVEEFEIHSLAPKREFVGPPGDGGKRTARGGSGLL